MPHTKSGGIWFRNNWEINLDRTLRVLWPLTLTWKTSIRLPLSNGHAWVILTQLTTPKFFLVTDSIFQGVKTNLFSDNLIFFLMICLIFWSINLFLVNKFYFWWNHFFFWRIIFFSDKPFFFLVNHYFFWWTIFFLMIYFSSVGTIYFSDRVIIFSDGTTFFFWRVKWVPKKRHKGASSK